MKNSKQRTANLLGAVVLGLHDRLRDAVMAESQLGGESAPAVVVIGHVAGLSNDRLSQLLGLTHTGTVRLVDKLVKQELVERRSSETDRRSVRLYLTDKGKSLRRRLLKRREASLSELLNHCDEKELDFLQQALSKLLILNSDDDTIRLRTCRLCDSKACGDCPIYVPVA